MKKTDRERMLKILQLWDKLKREVDERDITREQILTDEYTQWALTTPVYNIGEQVYNMSEETRSKHPEIQWKLVSGLRHRLVHDYEGINWSIIADVIIDDMPVFIESIKTIVD